MEEYLMVKVVRFLSEGGRVLTHEKNTEELTKSIDSDLRSGRCAKVVVTLAGGKEIICTPDVSLPDNER